MSKRISESTAVNQVSTDRKRRFVSRLLTPLQRRARYLARIRALGARRRARFLAIRRARYFARRRARLAAYRRARYLAHLRARMLSKRKTAVHTTSKIIGNKSTITITNNIWLPMAIIRKYGLRKVFRMTSSYKNRATLAALRRARYLARKKAQAARRRTGRCSYVGKDNRFLGGYPRSTGRRVFR